MADAAALSHDLDANLVKAIITVESNWNPKVSRFEPAWRYTVFPRAWASRVGVTELTEITLQSMSIGLTQVMGSVAREFGFADNLSDLFRPEVNLEYGCRKLASLVKKYPDEMDVIASYNAGSPRLTAGKLYENQVYVDKVWHALMDLRGNNGARPIPVIL
jgi:soluble lytic murein transglycosylase-like protein